jgi:hypothetical protein
MSSFADPDPHIRFPQKMGLRVPRGFPAAVDAVAERRHTSPSEWVRQTLLRAPRAGGRAIARRTRAGGPAMMHEALRFGRSLVVAAGLKK